MGNYVIATTKTWNINNFSKLKEIYSNDNLYLITQKNELTKEYLDTINPNFVFFPHWSWIIPNKIFENYKCIVFHMTDLPFGQGGSPLQNLIVRGIYNTKISAIKVSSGLDTGAIYMKEPINISEGNADSILKKVSNIIFEKMIPYIINYSPNPIEQSGESVVFKRRTPEESEIPEGLSPRQIYDYIRMLDGEGYPTAFKDINQYRLFFKNAKLKDGTVTATTTIIKR